MAGDRRSAPSGEWPADGRLARLVDRRRAELVRLGVLLTGSRTDAEDAVQEAVLAVSRSWTRVLAQASESAAFAYLRTATARKSIDLLRGRLPLDEVPDVPHDDRALLRFEEDRRFFDLVAGLPHRQRAVLVLRYYADWDDLRIAVLLRISPVTVRSNAMRGLAKLRAQLTLEEGQR